MDPISHLLKGSLFFLVLLKNCCVSLQTKFLSIVKREKEKNDQKTNIFTFTDCITTISYPNSNRGMNWMRIRTSWIDFEFGLSEKRPAAVDDDIELCRGRSAHVHSYTIDGPNSVTEREMLPPWSYLIWDQRKTRRAEMKTIQL